MQAVTQFHILHNEDDTIQVMQVVQQPDGSWPTVDECLAKLAKHTVKSHRPVELRHLPSDRYFRDAWHDPDKKGAVAVHMDRAREIHRNKLRELRVTKLQALDTEYIRADEIGDTDAKKRIVAIKQALRDVPNDPAIAAATTPDALKAVFPEILGERK